MARVLSLMLLTACATPVAVAPRVVKAERTPQPASLPEVAWAEPTAHARTLVSGLKVVVLEHHTRALTSMRLVFPSGTASEPAERSGVTWAALAALEERGEQHSADGVMTSIEEKSPRREAAEQGNSLSFGVSTEVSWLGFDGYAVDTRRGLTTLREVIRARRHGKEGVLARRDAQLDAIDEQQLTDDSTLVEQLSMLAFGRSHPYAQSVGGSIGSLNAMTDEAVVARQRELVQPQGAVLVIVGDFDAEAVLKQAASTFDGWWNEFTPATRPIAAVMPSKRTTVHVISRLPARTTMLCATRALGDVKEGDATIDVFAEVLRSRLSTTLRERGGFTYHVEGFVVHHDHARALALCTRLAAATTSEAVKVFLSTIADARTPDEAEVARTRAMLQTVRAIERRDAAGLSRSWAEAVARGKPPQLAEQQRALAEVTTEQVAAVGAKVLNRDQLQLLFSGDPTIIDAAIKAEGLGQTARVMLGH